MSRNAERRSSSDVGKMRSHSPLSVACSQIVHRGRMGHAEFCFTFSERSFERCDSFVRSSR
jgi:hypothetical protein